MGLLHRVRFVSYHEGYPLSDFFGSFGVVRPLPIFLFCPPGAASGFLRIGALLPALSLLVAFLATIRTFRGGFLLPVLGAASIPPDSGWLSELELPGCGACSENIFPIFPSMLLRTRTPNVTQELFAHTGREAIENSARRLFLGREVSVCRFRCCVICSIDIGPVSMPEQVLVHLVRPRCIVASIELLSWK